MRHLETAESQFEMLMQATPDDDIAGFEADLHELLEGGRQTTAVCSTAGRSETKTALAKVLAEEAARNPDEKKLLLDKRNRNWVPQIESMMVSKQTIFVTVGAAHLVGPGSVLDISVPARLEGAADQDRPVDAAAGLPRARDRRRRPRSAQARSPCGRSAASNKDM